MTLNKTEAAVVYTLKLSLEELKYIASAASDAFFDTEDDSPAEEFYDSLLKIIDVVIKG